MGRERSVPCRPNLGRPPLLLLSQIASRQSADHVAISYFRFGGSDTVPRGFRTAVPVVTYRPVEAERCGPLGGELPAIPVLLTKRAERPTLAGLTIDGPSATRKTQIAYFGPKSHPSTTYS